MDSISTGLDSSTTFDIMQTLKVHAITAQLFWIQLNRRPSKRQVAELASKIARRAGFCCSAGSNDYPQAINPPLPPSRSLFGTGGGQHLPLHGSRGVAAAAS